MIRFGLSLLFCFSSWIAKAEEGSPSHRAQELYKDSTESIYQGSFKLNRYAELIPNSQEQINSWQTFQAATLLSMEKQRQQGVAYMVSGVGLAIGMGFAYGSSHDATEKIVYSFAQSLSIGAIGYGYYSYYIGNQDRAFYEILNRSDLTEGQRDQLVQMYSEEKKRRGEQIRWLNFATYGLISVVNLINATGETDHSVQSTQYVLAGIYGVAALSFAF
ncbi:MAG: B domain-containing protein [Bdellovibrionales bacterium]|nr:B domain-containing protein [Bdellovibrionales bacterium]